jgi:hypothetical protein
MQTEAAGEAVPHGHGLTGGLCSGHRAFHGKVFAISSDLFEKPPAVGLETPSLSEQAQGPSTAIDFNNQYLIRRVPHPWHPGSFLKVEKGSPPTPGHVGAPENLRERQAVWPEGDKG